MNNCCFPRRSLNLGDLGKYIKSQPSKLQPTWTLFFFYWIADRIAKNRTEINLALISKFYSDAQCVTVVETCWGKQEALRDNNWADQTTFSEVWGKHQPLYVIQCEPQTSYTKQNPRALPQLVWERGSEHTHTHTHTHPRKLEVVSINFSMIFKIL